MNAAGIDVSSRKSTVAVLRTFGEVVRLPFYVYMTAASDKFLRRYYAKVRLSRHIRGSAAGGHGFYRTAKKLSSNT